MIELILGFWLLTVLCGCAVLYCSFAQKVVSTDIILAYAARMSVDDHCDILVDLQKRYGIRLGNQVAQWAFEVYQANNEEYRDDGYDDFVKDHPLITRRVKIGKSTKSIVSWLINPWTKDTLESVTPKVYLAMTGANYKSSLDKRGRIPIHHAVDSIASELGYQSSDDMVNAIREVIK